jgi:hypothetical protein
MSDSEVQSMASVALWLEAPEARTPMSQIATPCAPRFLRETSFAHWWKR